MCNILWIVVCPFVFFLWPLCCLSFFDLRILITPLVSSNSSCQHYRVNNFCCSPCIKIIIVYCNSQFINNVFIIITKVLLPLVYVLWFASYYKKTYILFEALIISNVIAETTTTGRMILRG
jgi:hypothetical protein